VGRAARVRAASAVGTGCGGSSSPGSSTRRSALGYPSRPRPLHLCDHRSPRSLRSWSPRQGQGTRQGSTCPSCRIAGAPRSIDASPSCGFTRADGLNRVHRPPETAMDSGTRMVVAVAAGITTQVGVLSGCGLTATIRLVRWGEATHRRPRGTQGVLRPPHRDRRGDGAAHHRFPRFPERGWDRDGEHPDPPSTVRGNTSGWTGGSAASRGRPGS
jgi:hypothetical protein